MCHVCVCVFSEMSCISVLTSIFDRYFIKDVAELVACTAAYGYLPPPAAAANEGVQA